MFGGDLLAQSLLAAGRTVKDRRGHSLHVSFLAPGDPTTPIEYRVRRLRDGRRFAQRQLSAWQGEREILIATASFTAEPPESHVHQHEAMPEVPGPEGLPSELDQRKAEADRLRPEDRPWLLTERAVEVRQVNPVPLVDPTKVPRSFAGRRFDLDLLADLPPGVDPCGENGEFHTFAWDGPMFGRPVPVRGGEVVTREGFVFADLLPA